MTCLRTLITIIICTSTFLIGGCASTPPPPLSEFEQSLLQDAPQKASVVIYRSTKEHWIHHPIPSGIYIDKKPFIRLKGKEYVQIYIPMGVHKFGVIHSRDGTEIRKWEKSFDLVSGHTYYLEIVVRIDEGFTWAWMPPLPLPVPTPLPFVGSIVDLNVRDAREARSNMGTQIDEELVKESRIYDSRHKEWLKYEDLLKRYEDLPNFAQ